MIISRKQSADGTCPEDYRKLNRFEIESDEQYEQWLLPETIAIGSRSTQSEHKAVSNFSFIGVISLTTGKMVPLLVKRNRNDKEVDLNLAA
jgi:hypothetical protein